MRKLLLLLLLPFTAPAQMINTIAGDGILGYTGDGYPATAAEIISPLCVAVDKAGNCYFGDNMLLDIRMVNTSGIISRMAGVGIGGYTGDGGPATQAQMNGVSCIVFDPAGNMYIADALNNVIRKINTEGIISTIAGTGYGAGLGYGGFSGDGGPATAARMSYPAGIALDKAGNLYITDLHNYRVRRVDTGGAITTVAGNGYSLFSGNGGPATAASLVGPTNIVTDTVGDIYFQDNSYIRTVNAAGIISNAVGTGLPGYSGDGGQATVAQMDEPAGLTIDSAGNLYIADTHNQRIRMVEAATGIITTIAGTGFPGYAGDGGPANAARFNQPSGIALDRSGNLYIADYNNNRVRKMSNTGPLHAPLMSGRDFAVYPNPATTQLTISSPDVITNVTITDLLGRVVNCSTHNATQVQVDLSAFAPGVYLACINGSAVREFLKE